MKRLFLILLITTATAVLIANSDLLFWSRGGLLRAVPLARSLFVAEDVASESVAPEKS